MPGAEPAGVIVRRVRPQDWQALRDLRLEALGDTPIGFLESLETAQVLDDTAWRARAARGADGGDSFQVLAWLDGRAVGTVVCFPEAAGGGHRSDAAWLAAVYVAPAARGAGLLGALIEPAAGWARERGRTVLRLEVHEDNARARRAYARLGFMETGIRKPYPLDPSREELLMDRRL